MEKVIDIMLLENIIIPVLFVLISFLSIVIMNIIFLKKEIKRDKQ